MKKTPFAISIVLIPHLAFAQVPKVSSAPAAPQCSLEGLTDDCEFFKKNANKQTIMLPDGTGFPNPLTTMPLKPARDPHMHGEVANRPMMGMEDPGAAYENVSRQIMTTGARALRVWKSLPSKKVSPQFQTAFNHLPPLPAFEAWSGLRPQPLPPGFPPPPKTVVLPWPPSDVNSRLVRVRVTDVVDYLNTLPTRQRNQMRAIFRDRSRLFSDMAGLEEQLYMMSNGQQGPPAANPMGSPMEQAQGPGIHPKLQSFFAYAQKTLLEEILKGRDLSRLSKEERGAYERVKSVKLIPPEPQDCITPFPNGSFKPMDHAITLCPGLEDYPHSFVMRLLGHELAHSFDPCVELMPLIKGTRKIRELAADESSWPDEIRKNPDLLEAARLVRTNPSEYSSFAPIVEMNDPKSIEKLAKLGYIDIIAPAADSKKSPNVAAYSCIRDQGGIKEVTEKDIESIIEKAEIAPAERAAYAKKLKPYAQCLEAPNHVGHMCEAMSDAWGSKVLGRWLSENPPKSEAERVGILAVEARVCAKGLSSRQLTIRDIVEKTKEKALSPHPSMRSRSNNIVLQEPRVQKAIGCAPTKTEVQCLTKIGTNGPLPSSGAPTRSPRTPVDSSRSVQ